MSWMREQLPFGRTTATDVDLRNSIDIHTASACLSNNGVDDPNTRIQAFIECLPELLDWLATNGREYPWRYTTDPWKIYVAEILLQRTRGDAVADIYEDFIDRFPSPRTLHDAQEEAIRDVVHSLGFVNHRTRTFQEVGKLFTEEHGEEIPNSLEELTRPWRVGEYSARACQLFARGESLALVDSNFARVIGRALGYNMPSQPHKSSAVYELLGGLTPDDPALARAFNLAILDLGAKVCTSSNPDCSACPLQRGCVYAEEQGLD